MTDKDDIMVCEKWLEGWENSDNHIKWWVSVLHELGNGGVYTLEHW